MGVKDLSKELRPPRKLTSNMSEFKDKILGIDASIYLHKAINSSSEISALFHQHPPVTVRPLIDRYFDKLYATFKSHGIKILLVIDGGRNPLKSGTNDARKKISIDAVNSMLELIESGDQDVLTRIAILRKKAIYVRDDILGNLIKWCDRNDINYLGAYMEAEWELCSLATAEIIDGVLSKDSDCFPLRNQILI
jgi:5'-3' exonuclease